MENSGVMWNAIELKLNRIQCLLQREFTSDRSMVAATRSRVFATIVRPMCCRIKDVINVSITWPSFGRIRPCETVVLEITFETASLNLIEHRGVRIHIPHHDRRRILRTQLLPFVQKHPCDLRVSGLGPGFVVIVRQVGVEEPDRDIV